MDIDSVDMKRRFDEVKRAIEGLPNFIALWILTGCIGEVFSTYGSAAAQETEELGGTSANS